MSILRVKDDQGNYVEIPAIKGEPGASGVIDATTESALTGLLKGAGGHIAPGGGRGRIMLLPLIWRRNRIRSPPPGCSRETVPEESPQLWRERIMLHPSVWRRNKIKSPRLGC